jgi:multidrug efflux pump subunit AcrA (membrane-fusion protein)
MSRPFLILVLAVAMLSLATYHLVHTGRAPPPLDPPARPARAPYADTIAGTGLIEPWTENIALGTHAAGVVREVCVKVGDHVDEGAPVFRIDDRQWRADLAVRETRLAFTRAQLARLEEQPRREELPGSAARLREAQARHAEEEDRFARSQKLIERRIISEEEFAQRRQALAVAREQLAKAQADDDLLRAGAWEFDKNTARATVAEAQAQVDQARTEIDRLTVKAPVPGIVLQINVRPGEYVAQPSNQQLLVLGNIEPLHVRVDIDEADIPRFQKRLPARGFVRGDAAHPIDLEFVRVELYVVPKRSLTGNSTERVDTRVLQVIFAVRDADFPLYVGQQLDVFVEAGSPGGAQPAPLRRNHSPPRTSAALEQPGDSQRSSVER